MSNAVIVKFEYPTMLDRATVLMINTREKTYLVSSSSNLNKKSFFSLKNKNKNLIVLDFTVVKDASDHLQFF